MLVLAFLRRVWYAVTHRKAPGFWCLVCGRAGGWSREYVAVSGGELIEPLCQGCYDKIDETITIPDMSSETDRSIDGEHPLALANQVLVAHGIPFDDVALSERFTFESVSSGQQEGEHELDAALRICREDSIAVDQAAWGKARDAAVAAEG